MRSVIYARVSTAEGHRRRREDSRGQDTEVQLAQLREYCGRRGWTVVAEAVDRQSGARAERAGWDRVSRLARRRAVDAVVVVALDRVGRNLGHLVGVLDELAALDVALVSLREGVDATTPSGRALMSMAAVFSEFERSVVAERVRAGMQRARQAGRRIGRPPVGLDLQRVVQLRGQGASIRCIARELGVGKSTVAAALGGVREGSSSSPA